MVEACTFDGNEIVFGDPLMGLSMNVFEPWFSAGQTHRFPVGLEEVLCGTGLHKLPKGIFINNVIVARTVEDTGCDPWLPRVLVEAKMSSKRRIFSHL